MGRDDYEIFDVLRDEQRKRRDERRPRYLQYATEIGVEWRWLNEPYQIRFGPDDNFVDFFTTHAVVAFKGKNGRLVYRRGFKALENALRDHGLTREACDNEKA